MSLVRGLNVTNVVAFALSGAILGALALRFGADRDDLYLVAPTPPEKGGSQSSAIEPSPAPDDADLD